MKKRIYVVLIVPALVLALLITASFATVGVAKADAVSSSSQKAIPSASGICYQAHVQNIGWQSQVCNNQVAGTVGQSLRLEAIRIFLVRRF